MKNVNFEILEVGESRKLNTDSLSVQMNCQYNNNYFTGNRQNNIQVGLIIYINISKPNNLQPMQQFHKQLPLCFMLITLIASQGCSGFYGGDLVQSGQYAITNPYNDAYSFTYTTQVAFTIPSTGLQISVTTSTIANYNPLKDWGYNYFLGGQRKKATQNVEFELIIVSDNSWESIQIAFLFSGRTDMAIGNFQADISKFTQLSPGVYQVTTYLHDELPDTKYQVATFISGFSIYIQDYTLAINQNYFKKSEKTLGVIFHTSTTSILSIMFSYIIYPETHSVFTFDYNVYPRGQGSYHVSGPVKFDKRVIKYEEWAIQSRYLACTGSICASSCVLTEKCIENYGNVWQGRCIYCAPGIVFGNGACLRSCGANQFYFRGRNICLCNEGYDRVGNACVKKQECGANQNRVNNKCICNPSYSLWQDECRKCPDGASASLDRSTCVCPDDKFFKPIENICEPKCKGSGQHWVTDRCVCLENFMVQNDGCRACPANSNPNTEKTTCVCTNTNHVFFYNENVCRACPAGQFPNSARTQCLCPANTKNENGVCKPNCPAPKVYNQADSTCQCPFGFIDVGGVCIERCALNEKFENNVCICIDGYAKYSGPCKQCPVGTSKVSADRKWCICNQAKQIFNPSRLLCETCPANSSPNADKTKCQCNSGFVADKDGNCVRISNCPARSSFDQNTLSCVCDSTNQHLIGGVCKACPVNQGWNGKQCVCVQDYYRINGVCRTCDPRSTYNGKDCVCNVGFFGNRDKCEACHITCSQCSGTQASQCTACADISLVLQNGYCSKGGVCPIGSFLDKAECKTCIPYCVNCTGELDCNECSRGFQIEQFDFGSQKISSCAEVCGDGRRFEAECDDGNKKSGDGCNENCQIQAGWTCEGGTSIKKDTCSNFVPTSTILSAKAAVNQGNNVIQSVRASYLPDCITQNECAQCFKALDVRVLQAFVPVKVVVSYVPLSKYQFFIEYSFDGLFVTSAFRVSIRLNRDFYHCFSASDFNQVLDIQIDPATLKKCDPVGTLIDLSNLSADETSTCNS